ncbi:hypothetical protein ACA910_019076 [Epithemia clementina (nom. ined.)]
MVEQNQDNTSAPGPEDQASSGSGGEEEATKTPKKEDDGSDKNSAIIEDQEQAAIALKDAGNVELQKGHYLEAINYYSQGLELSPKNAVLLSNRALSYIKIENYGLALQDADRAIASDPKYAKGYYRRASANFALNHFKLARKDFRQVCQLKPKDRDARSKLNECEKAVKEEAFSKAIQAEQTQPLSATYKPENIEITNSYQGPKPTIAAADGGATIATIDEDEEIPVFKPGNLPREFVLSCVEWMKSQKQVHKRYVARVLLSCRAMFAETSSLMRIDIPKDPPELSQLWPNTFEEKSGDANLKKPRITVCGDTHGQYYDLLNIFEKNGFPHRTNPYLFNGDFVDRGSFSLEVILTLLLFKLSDPTCIYLTRGNHETKNMNRIYGFEGEVKAKYDDKIFNLFLEVFEWLPLSAVIANKVFVTHGGLPTDPTVTLNDIAAIARGMEPPEAGLMSDLLWSDPQPFPGKSPSKRGIGFSFGPDITEAFLKRNGLQVLVRSHEVKEEGYLVEHGGKTITVFSAPNYCDTMGNKGAFIHFFGEDSNNSYSNTILEPVYTQFEAVPHPDVKPMAYAAGMGGLFS